MTDSDNNREQDPSIRQFPGEYLDRTHHLSRARLVARDSVRASLAAEAPLAPPVEAPRPAPEVQPAVHTALPAHETTPPASSADEFDREAEVLRRRAQVAQVYNQEAA